MNYFEGIIEELNAADFEVIGEGFKRMDDLNKSIANTFSRLRDAIKVYQETGIVTNVSDIFYDYEETPPVDPTTIKENIEPKSKTSAQEPGSGPRTRPRRNAFKEATQNISEQNKMSLNSKLRRPSKLEAPLPDVFVKVERLSTYPPQETEDIKVKTEIEEMPAPSKPAPHRKKRKESKIQVKQEIEDRDSDVIVEDVTVTVVDLVDSLDETIKQEKIEKKTRSTRTKTKKTKRSRTHSSEDEVIKTTRKRSKSNDEDDLQHDKVADATFVAKPAETQPNMNSTVVVENPKHPDLIPKSVDDLMTEDESEEEKKKEPPKRTGAISKLVKQVFSPFEQSPVKQKVQAFEKLQEEACSLPQRITRTKTRARAGEEAEPKSVVKEKAKLFTPVASKFAPKAASTAMKSSAPNESLLSSKSVSALKASQAEYRERERKRREKEQDALKKREALIQVQIEEKKRKREEKQLKAQQQREILEREKLKVLEAQRLKDERHKQVMAEQEERKQKQKQEIEKKRLMAKMKAVEEKKREEEKRLEEERRAEELSAKLAKRDEEVARMVKEQKEKQIPIYMWVKAPLLPTDDCYDSDDDRYKNESFVEPAWSEESNLRLIQRCAFAPGEAIKNSFFSIQAQTADLQDIFEVIAPKKLKRSSSAVWHKPPRYTMMPPLEDHDETEEFDEDFVSS